VPSGQPAVNLHPSLNNLNIGLSWDGSASFDSPDWKLGIAPVGFSLSAPKLLKGDGLHYLQGEDGEIGFSFDKHGSRHFFLIGKSLSLPKFSLQLQVCLFLWVFFFPFLYIYLFTSILHLVPLPPIPPSSFHCKPFLSIRLLKCSSQLDGSSRVEFNKEKGVIVILDKSGKPRLVYSAPVVALSNNKTITLPLEWDAPSSSFSITLPDLSFPIAIAFGLGVKVPDVKGGFGFSFPSFKFGAKGEVESAEVEEEEEEEEEEIEVKPKEKGKKVSFGFKVRYL